jgi:uncharacterized protein
MITLRFLLCCLIAITLTSCAAIPDRTDEVDSGSTPEWGGIQTWDNLDHLSIAELERRTAAGDTKAQAELGARYGRGEGVEQDLDRAMEILRDAAKKGEPEAEFFIGTAYYNGTGVPRSEVGAVMWFEKAVAKGHAPAQYWLAVLIKEGRGGIGANWEAAVPLLWDSAMQGYPHAEFLLGYAYQTGAGVEKNVNAAAYWYRRNLSKGYNMRSHFNLAFMINEGQVDWQPGDPEELKSRSASRR